MAVSNEEINQWWTQNAGASDAQVANWMQGSGISAEQLGGAIGYDAGAIQQKYDAAIGSYSGDTGGASAYGYTPPTVNANASASDVEGMYRQYTQVNGGDTEANRNAAIDYLRGSGVSDSVIGQAYKQYSATPDRTFSAGPGVGGQAPGTRVIKPGQGNAGNYIPSLSFAPDSNAQLGKNMTPLDIAKWYYGVTAGVGGDSVYQREKSIDYLKAAGLSDAQIGAGWQEYLRHAGTTGATTGGSGALSAGVSPNPATSGAVGGRPPAGQSYGSTGYSGFSTGGAPSLGFNLSNISGPSRWDVSGNQTVANQLTALMASDNPLIQQARAWAMQQSNARGLSNSSIAQTAADAAAYDAMMQVAKQDAGTYASAAQSNTAAQNQFTSDANAFLRNGYMADFNLSANEWAAQQAYARDREAQREQNAFNLAAMERENELNKGNTTSANSQSDRQGYINALNQSRNEWSSKYAGVMADPNMSPENKKDALKSLAASYNTQIKAYTGLLGWDYASWDIEYTVDEPAAAANKPVDTTTTTNYP